MDIPREKPIAGWLYIRSSEFHWTAVLVFVMGCVLGGLFFSPDSGIPNPEGGGDPVEWIAAFATVSVGYVAARIARQAHEHNTRAAADMDDRKRKTDLAELLVFQYEMKRVENASTIMSGHMENTGLTKGGFEMSFELTKAMIGNVDWPRAALPLLTAKEIDLLKAVQARVDRIKHRGDRALASLIGVKDTDTLNSGMSIYIGSTKKAAKSCRDRSKELTALLEQKLKDMGWTPPT